jgi:2'-5' RNA ligase
MKSVLFSVWLVPNKSDRKGLVSLIKDLAKVHKAASFLPHVTLYACEVSSQLVPQAIEFVRKSADPIGPLSLKIKDVAHSPEFFKCVYLTLEGNPLLSRLYQSVRKKFQRFGDYKLKPHLSLVYKELPVAKRKAIVLSLQVDPSVSFGEIGFVVHELDETQHRRVNTWRYKKICQL